MEAGRIWQRGASKGRKGSTNARMMKEGGYNQNNDDYHGNKYSHRGGKPSQNDFGDDQNQDQSDIMMSALQKSLIAETLQGARAQINVHQAKASLNEPSRPFTPGDIPRHLFHGNDYTNRPGSSYKMNNVIGQAADEFASIAGSNISINSTSKTQANTYSDYQLSTNADVLSIIERHQTQTKSGQIQFNPNNLKAPQLRPILPNHVLPSLDHNQLQKNKISKKSSNITDQKSAQNNSQIKQEKPQETQKVKQPQLSSRKLEDKKKEEKIILNQQEKPSMKDFEDLIGNENKIKQTEAKYKNIKNSFDMIQNQMRENQSKKKAQNSEDNDLDDYADELQDQMTESLFNEADQMGIFQIQSHSAADYDAALKKIGEEIKKQELKQEDGQINSFSKIQKSEYLEEDQNNELYNQIIDDDGNLVDQQTKPQFSYFEVEYQETISIISKVCRNIVWNNNPVNKDRRMIINEDEIIDIAPRILSIINQYDQQTQNEQQKCQLQTLLKGSFSLLGVKIPRCAIKMSSCNIQIFFKIFDKIVKAHRNFLSNIKNKEVTLNVSSNDNKFLSSKPSNKNLNVKQEEISKDQNVNKDQLKKNIIQQQNDHINEYHQLQKVAGDVDFAKVFGYLFETMRGLLIYAKEGEFDKLFIEEKIIPQLAQIIQKCFCDHSDLIIKLTSQIVNNKIITNDDQIYDLMNYTIGTIKCFTQSIREVQKITVQNQMIAILSKALQKTFIFGKNQNKQSMILVQISGTLRNLANVEDSYGLLLYCQILPKLCQIYGDDRFKGHKELILNVSRLLSKVSIDFNCAEQMVQTKNTLIFLDTLELYRENSAVLIRVAFVLGNLTTHYVMARRELCQTGDCFNRVIKLGQFYLDKDIQGLNQVKEQVQQKEQKQKKYEEFSVGNIEDAITKIVKLLANLSTEEQYAQSQFFNEKNQVKEFVNSLVQAIDKRTIDNNEEFILNAISCLTNILFYDIPNRELLSNDIRINIFNSIKLYILATQNEEIQIETVRVLSNLSRHALLCDEFVSDSTYLEALSIVLDHTLRDLVFYSVGIIINISLHQETRHKVLERQNLIPKLIDILKDSNIEDIDLSKVTAKALHNMTQIKGESQNSVNQFWSNECIIKLEEVLQNLGDELDQIMDVASESELEEIQSLRKLINALNNDMPEQTIKCTQDGCGRQFKNQKDLEEHFQRRHKQTK